MLFYAFLTIAGVIAAAVLVWIFRSLSVAGTSAYRNFSPTARAASGARLAHLNSNLAATPAPWGWGGRRGSRPRYQGMLPETRAQARVAESRRELGSRMEVLASGSSKDKGPYSSVGNVLTGYDMRRHTQPDTSSWPYRDSLTESRLRSLEEEKNTLVEDGKDHPSKPWGW